VLPHTRLFLLRYFMRHDFSLRVLDFRPTMFNRQSYRSQIGGYSRDVREVVNSNARSQYEQAVASFVPQRGRQGWHVTPARRQHNIRRTEQMSHEGT
jgi:hypothetical protein